MILKAFISIASIKLI